MNIAAFLRIFIPLMMALLASKAVVHTDLLMIAPLGEMYLAAYAVPTRIMMVDAIVAFALAPIISVLVGRSDDSDSRYGHITLSISICVYAAVVLTGFGLLVYPLVAEQVISDEVVLGLSLPALLILTLAIIFRMLYFLGSMILYALDQGRKVIPCLIIAVIFNAILNWYFIYFLDYGFVGAYYATFLVSVFECAYIIYHLRSYLSFVSVLKIPDWSEVFPLFKGAGAEFARLASLFTFQLVVLAVYASDTDWVLEMGVYSVAIELYILLSVPMIAAMRSCAIVAARQSKDVDRLGLNHFIMPVYTRGVACIVLFALVFFMIHSQLATDWYHISDNVYDWWVSFVVLSVLTLPFLFFNALNRGVWQSENNYGILLKVDFFTQWFVALPLVMTGLYLSSSWLAWSWMLVVEISVTIILILFRLRKKRIIAIQSVDT